MPKMYAFSLASALYLFYQGDFDSFVLLLLQAEIDNIFSIFIVLPRVSIKE